MKNKKIEMTKEDWINLRDTHFNILRLQEILRTDMDISHIETNEKNDLIDECESIMAYLCDLMERIYNDERKW